MAADGSYRALSGAPQPDAARVAAIRETLTPAADFAESACAAVRNALERLTGQARAAGQEDCAGLIADIRARIDGLSPSALTPRRGLGGLFDSHGKRLKRFREAFRDTERALASAASAVGERIGVVDSRHAALDAVADDLRQAAGELAAHLAAARDWLTGHTPAEGEDQALTEFRGRIDTVSGVLTDAVRALPLARAVQNADARVRDGLDRVTAALSGWKDDWAKGLGLDGKRPRRVRPTPDALIPARDAVGDALARLERELAAMTARRREIDARLTPPA